MMDPPDVRHDAVEHLSRNLPELVVPNADLLIDAKRKVGDRVIQE